MGNMVQSQDRGFFQYFLEKSFFEKTTEVARAGNVGPAPKSTQPHNRMCAEVHRYIHQFRLR